MTKRIKKTEKVLIKSISNYEIIDIVENKSLNQYTTDNKELDLCFSKAIKKYAKLFNVTLRKYEYDLDVIGDSWNSECNIMIYAVIDLIEKDEAFEKRKRSSEVNRQKAKERKKLKEQEKKEAEIAEYKRLKELYGDL